MDINDLRAIFTVLTFLCFVGIVAWAFSGRRKQAFGEAERLPLDDDYPLVDGQRGAGKADN